MYNIMIKLHNKTILASNQFNLVTPCQINMVKTIQENFETKEEYNNYLLCSLTHIFHDNLFFYQIPKSFKVYSSDQNIPKTPISLYLNKLDTNATNIYEHTFKKATELVDLQMKSNLDVLKATAITQHQSQLVDILNQKPFKIADFSTLLPYFCSLGLAGCITPSSTIYLCQPHEYLSTGQVFP
jgi:hypothetical protein